ncbi:MAG TPA: aminoglycoside phosphotransferase [Thiotrichales bacterium]|nr:aminoglycoside phosphotransferase [Thiotrichales bacterium]
MEGDKLARLVEHLQSPTAYPHPVADIQVIETHISYILLTGDYAYKLKKPVDLGFLDFSTLEKRHHFCEEELRLNRRLAPELYLDVVGIHGDPEAPVIGGEGPLLEYAVKMRQFPAEARMDRVTERGELTPQQIDQIARSIAEFHQRVAKTPLDNGFGSADMIRHQVFQNFDQIHARVQETPVEEQCARLRTWTECTFAAHEEEFEQRRREGWVRECHGDLHLANMALLDGKVTFFDCLEFSPELRWIDTISEIAFLYMDLDYRQQTGFARRFLNQYLIWSNDYMGLSLLRFYLVYRAMVRAKVNAIAMEQHRGEPRLAADYETTLKHYLALAERYTEEHDSPPIVMLHGCAGVGKSWLAERLVEALGAVQIRSDIERKRLLGLPPDATTRTRGFGVGPYAPDSTTRTYQRLQALAYSIVDAGLPAIVDATFLKKEYRTPFLWLARTARLPVVILSLHARPETMRERIRKRAAEGGDPSEATLEILERQLELVEPITDSEMPFTIEVDTEQPIDVTALAHRILSAKRVPDIAAAPLRA